MIRLYRIHARARKSRISSVILVSSLIVVGLGASGDPQSQSKDDAGTVNPQGSRVELPDAEGLEKATFGAGCFWGVEKVFQDTEGVVEAVSGFAGGYADAPTYTQVCSGTTGHAEVVQVFYDPEVVSYDDLLDTYWTLGIPSGELSDQQREYQYRHTILYHDEEQRQKVEAAIEQMAQETGRRPAVYLEPLETFFLAEEYHQDFYFKSME
jgi:peptide-methionine (S)-S-oxide reductase